MAKVTLPTFTSLTNESSFLSQLNAAMASLAAAIELTLSRNGTSPNTMTEVLDMNSKRIINVAAPVDDYDVARLIDMVEGVVGPQGAPGQDGADGAPGGPLSDGDYGDIVVSGSGTAWAIDSALMSSVARTLTAQTTQALMRSTGLGLGGASTLNVGTSAGTVAAGDDSRFTEFTINSQSGATYTFATTDKGKLVRQTAAGAHTYTINPNATTAITVGAVILVKNSASAGDLTISRGAGVSLYLNGSTTSANVTVAAGGFVQLIQEATDTWIAIGVGVS